MLRRYANIFYSVPTDQKDSGIKKSYMGVVKRQAERRI